MLIDNCLSIVMTRTAAGLCMCASAGARNCMVCDENSCVLGAKATFAPENIFIRTVDTPWPIPLDIMWTTHVYHHRSMQDRKLSMTPVVFTMVCSVGYMRSWWTNTWSSSANSCSCGALYFVHSTLLTSMR